MDHNNLNGGYPDTISQMGGGAGMVPGAVTQIETIDGRAGLRSNREELRPQKKMFGQANTSKIQLFGNNTP